MVHLVLFARDAYYKTFINITMQILETPANQLQEVITENKSHCCGKCANKINSFNAHCGKTHSIEELLKTGSQINDFDLNHLKPDALADYIFNEYHQYYYNQEPVLLGLILKAADDAGTSYPVIHRLEVLFGKLKNALSDHLLLEEQMLFPHIKKLVQAKRDKNFSLPPGSKHFADFVSGMQDEHRIIEEILCGISLITGAYTHAANATSNFSLLYQKLKALHENLKQYTFIENHFLYPKAIQLEDELKELGLL